MQSDSELDDKTENNSKVIIYVKYDWFLREVNYQVIVNKTQIKIYTDSFLG